MMSLFTQRKSMGTLVEKRCAHAHHLIVGVFMVSEDFFDALCCSKDLIDFIEFGVFSTTCSQMIVSSLDAMISKVSS